MTDRPMTIGEVAGRTGFSVQAIRYYEREGLLPKPDRTHTGYRIYGPEILGRLNFLYHSRSLGLPLKEVKEIFRMSKAGQSPCCRVRELLAAKIEELNRRITEYRQFRDQLRRFFEKLADVPDQSDTSRQVCALIEMAPTISPPARDDRNRTLMGERKAKPLKTAFSRASRQPGTGAVSPKGARKR